MDFEKRGIKRVRLEDVCLFREVEWFRTLMRWILEASFPIDVNGIEIRLNFQSLVSKETDMHHEKAPKPIKNKKRRMKLSIWTWKLLFRILSRILISVSDVAIHIEVIAKGV